MEIGHQFSGMHVDITRHQWWILINIGIIAVMGFTGCVSPISSTTPGNEGSAIPATKSHTPFPTEAISTADNTATVPEPTANLITQIPNLTITPGHGTEQGCKSKLIQITLPPVPEFYWSDDGKTLYFRDVGLGGGWQGYSTSNNEYFISPNFTPTTPESIAQTFNITDWWDLSLSPEEDQLIFTRKSEASLEPTPNPPDEAASNIFYLDLYVIKKGSDKPIHLGQIDGQIERILWFPDGTKALVIGTYYPHGPFRVASVPMWIVDLNDYSMTPLYIGDLGTDLTAIDGISPDGQWVIYHFLDGATTAKTIRMRNITNGDDQELLLTPYVRILQTLPDGRHMVILNRLERQNPDVETLMAPYVISVFDMKTNRDVPLTAHDIYPAYYVSDPVKLSPDMSFLAYVEDGSGRLWLLTLCWPELSSGG
jgi:hypothetical protein